MSCEQKSFQKKINIYDFLCFNFYIQDPDVLEMNFLKIMLFKREKRENNAILDY